MRCECEMLVEWGEVGLFEENPVPALLFPPQMRWTGSGLNMVFRRQRPATVPMNFMFFFALYIVIQL